MTRNDTPIRIENLQARLAGLPFLARYRVWRTLRRLRRGLA